MGGAGVRKIPQWVGAKADNFIQALFPSLSTIMSSKIPLWFADDMNVIAPLFAFC
jgi:hypothetical protein